MRLNLDYLRQGATLNHDEGAAIADELEELRSCVKQLEERVKELEVQLNGGGAWEG